MCDYSLLGVRNRLAEEGEPLIVYRFPSGSLGLASPSEFAPVRTAPAGAPWWTRAAVALTNGLCRAFQTRSPCAVCIPPGTRLVLRDIPGRLRTPLEVGEEEEATFVQQDNSPYRYRDAVRFRNGKEVLLQKLVPGQRVDVLFVPAGAVLEPWAEGTRLRDERRIGTRQ